MATTGPHKLIAIFGLVDITDIMWPLLLNYYPYQEQDAQKELAIVKSNAIEFEENFINVKYIIGAILFFNMSIFHKIGFFDEKIFLYYEDDEINPITCITICSNNKCI